MADLDIKLGDYMRQEIIDARNRKFWKDMEEGVKLGLSAVELSKTYHYGLRKVRNYLKARHPDLINPPRHPFKLTVLNLESGDEHFDSMRQLAKAIKSDQDLHFNKPMSLSTIRNRIRDAISRFEKTREPQVIVEIDTDNDNYQIILLNVNLTS